MYTWIFLGADMPNVPHETVLIVKILRVELEYDGFSVEGRLCLTP
jgi:hypothetical protein